jgi:hypothetical protein
MEENMRRFVEVQHEYSGVRMASGIMGLRPV